jgi:hypothetical protein
MRVLFSGFLSLSDIARAMCAKKLPNGKAFLAQTRTHLDLSCSEIKRFRGLVRKHAQAQQRADATAATALSSQLELVLVDVRKAVSPMASASPM